MFMLQTKNKNCIHCRYQNTVAFCVSQKFVARFPGAAAGQPLVQPATQLHAAGKGCPKQVDNKGAKVPKKKNREFVEMIFEISNGTFRKTVRFVTISPTSFLTDDFWVKWLDMGVSKNRGIPKIDGL